MCDLLERDVARGSTSAISDVHVSITPNQFAYYLHWILSVVGKFSREISNLNSASHAFINRISAIPQYPNGNFYTCPIVWLPFGLEAGANTICRWNFE